MRTTSIKETLERHSQKTAENAPQHSEPAHRHSEQSEESLANETSPQPPPKEGENSLPIGEGWGGVQTTFKAFSKECWEECVQISCKNSKIAEVLLLKVNPSPTDDYKIEIEVANEIEKSEIRQVQASLLQNLYEKTGNQYSLELQITKTVREKAIDKSNPDEKFIQLCKENPYLLEFKQRLNLSVS